jgi:hypothetical protein
MVCSAKMPPVMYEWIGDTTGQQYNHTHGRVMWEKRTVSFAGQVAGHLPVDPPVAHVAVQILTRPRPSAGPFAGNNAEDKNVRKKQSQRTSCDSLYIGLTPETDVCSEIT